MSNLPPLSVELASLLARGEGSINLIRNALKWAGSQHPRAKGTVPPTHHWDEAEMLKIPKFSIDAKRKTAGMMWLEYELSGINVNQGVNMKPVVH